MSCSAHMKFPAFLYSPLGSGADPTTRRIASHLNAGSHFVLLERDSRDPEELARVANENDIDVLLGTHALFSGLPFLEVGPPYVLVLGGTDLNEFAMDEAYLRTDPSDFRSGSGSSST